MLTWKQAVIARAAQFLNSTERTIEYECAAFPNHESFTNTNQSLQIAAVKLVRSIRMEREAEAAFFKAHPELNP